MLLVFVFSGAAAVSVLGLGHLVARRLAPAAGPAVSGLLGLALLAAAGMALNLAVPLGPWIGAGALAAGIGAFAWNARRILSGVPAVQLAALVLLLAAFAALSDVPWRHYDLGLYWLQSVKWITESRQPLGLATLHVRLGFNSSWFAVCAMLEHPLTVGRSGFLAANVVLLFGAWLAADAFRAAWRGRRGLPELLAASSALLVVTGLRFLGGHSPDAPAAIVGFAAILCWARAFEDGPDRRSHATGAVLLSAFAFTVKLASGMLVAAAPVLLLLLRSGGAAVPLGARAAASLGLLVPWTLRGYLASGCPLYPTSLGCIPFPWATPARFGSDVLRWIRSWARTPNVSPQATQGWAWVRGWASDLSEMWSMRIVVGTLAVALVALAVQRRRPSPGLLPLTATALAGVALWFFGAPDPRFGFAYLFALALLPACEALARGLATRWRRWVAAAAVAAALAASVGLGLESIEWMSEIPDARFTLAEWPPMPQGTLFTKERETLTGLRVRVPVIADQCWDAPLPCTPYFDAGLSNDGMFRTATGDPRGL